MVIEITPDDLANGIFILQVEAGFDVDSGEFNAQIYTIGNIKSHEFDENDSHDYPLWTSSETYSSIEDAKIAASQHLAEKLKGLLS